MKLVNLSTSLNSQLSSFPPSNNNNFITFNNPFAHKFQVSLSFNHQNPHYFFNISFSLPSNFSFHKSPCSKIITFASLSTTNTSFNGSPTNSKENVHWMVIMDKPPKGVQSKAQIINYFVSTLEKALGSEKDAQSCIYDASIDTHFGFCCIVSEEISRFLSGLPEVLCVRPDLDVNSVKKDYSIDNLQEDSMPNSQKQNPLFLPKGLKYWLVRVKKSLSRVSSKAQAVNFYVKTLTKVLGNEKDAQMCMYHISWQSNLGFCCVLDDESAQELAAVPGVLSVEPDEHFESEDKDYGGDNLSSDNSDLRQASEMSKTKLFITGLSFYTSEKTLRAAFEPFGELVEVKVIMDKISKRSKGYAFVEYTTEDAATMALREMNGKIINGWMIIVDRAKKKPVHNKERAKTFSSQNTKL